eukprot:3694144-Amphidinium_carterae.1
MLPTTQQRGTLQGQRSNPSLDLRGAQIILGIVQQISPSLERTLTVQEDNTGLIVELAVSNPTTFLRNGMRMIGNGGSQGGIPPASGGGKGHGGGGGGGGRGRQDPDEENEPDKRPPVRRERWKRWKRRL